MLAAFSTLRTTPGVLRASGSASVSVDSERVCAGRGSAWRWRDEAEDATVRVQRRALPINGSAQCDAIPS